ncbi:ROK family protein [Mucilaginibacter sp. PAMB04168]|uniref:ROK family protein n=1 Tax=Mucilaginibacter sp. PAMB04168 TaxID=3138567 RepID=UPI0031F6DAD7
MNAVLGMLVSRSNVSTGLVDVNSKTLYQNTLCQSAIDYSGISDEILNTLLAHIKQAFEHTPVHQQKIAIAVPGPFDYENGISLFKSPRKHGAIYGIDIKTWLVRHLKVDPANIHFVNDTAAFLQGEILHGNVGSHNCALGVKLDRTPGISIFENDLSCCEPLESLVFKDRTAQECLSTQWLSRKYYELTGINMEFESYRSSYSGTIKDVIKEYIENLCIILSHFVNEYDPQIIVIDGDITKAVPKFLFQIRSALLKDQIKTPVFLSTLKNIAAITGCASLFPN